jgi:hypothetical protein
VVRPKSLVCCRSGGIGTCTQVALTFEIFTWSLLPQASRARGGARETSARHRR